uniref:Putative ovule protein n=1 Tax=Solanum chacoense TaxID=4108 RepID=A0A0V0HAA2_SOLCH
MNFYLFGKMNKQLKQFWFSQLQLQLQLHLIWTTDPKFHMIYYHGSQVRSSKYLWVKFVYTPIQYMCVMCLSFIVHFT